MRDEDQTFIEPTFIATYTRPEWAFTTLASCGHSVAVQWLYGGCMSCEVEAYLKREDPSEAWSAADER